MAVLTDGNPSHEYGTETLRGVAQRLFARPVRGAAPEKDARRRRAPPPAARASWTFTASRRASA